MKFQAMNVTLRPDRSLLDPNFESYKLSLLKIPVYEANVGRKVRHRPVEEVSKQHLKAYSNINCLHNNPFDAGRVYYFGADGSVISVSLPEFPQNFDSGKVIFTFPDCGDLSSTEKLATASIQFPAAFHISLYDGLGNLYLLKSDELYSEDSFTVVGSIQPPVHKKHSQLLDCLLVSNESQLYLHCLFTCVSDKSECDLIVTDSTSAYVTYLEWISYTSSTSYESWSLVRHQKLVASSFPDYAAFEGDCSALHICSERKFHAIYDSHNSLSYKADVNECGASKAVETKISASVNDTRFSVTWSQTDTDEDMDLNLLSIAITLNNVTLPLSFGPNIVLVQIAPVCERARDYQILSVKLCSYISTNESEKVNNDPIILIDQTLYGPVSPTSSWTYDRKANCIEVHINKQTTQYWPRLLLDSREDEKLRYAQTLGVEDQSDVEGTILKPPFNVGQLEEVDFPMSEDDPDLVLQRFDHETLRCTHQVHLSGHQWLFKIRCAESKSNATHAFCIRQDVDGIVWLPQCHFTSMKTNSDIDQYVWKHVSTLQAFGYVLASKRESRFVSSPVLFNETPLKFVAVADFTRRIYIYCQPLPSSAKDTELRKRITANSSPTKEQQVVHVASQHVVSLPTNEPIIGFVATDKPYASCLVCTQSTLYLLPIDG
uniref:NudC domain-containing protein 1 n=1 Tax=Trichobilharzia regenti TaxID=157069 RepID=A0AA85JR56_TRIRE|nr:unnamed protein product [Trichobilharzia regenti]